MATARPTIFGAYEWATSDFAESFDPETFNVVLSDSVTGTEADLINTTKVLADSLSLTDAELHSVIKALTETVTGSETFAKTVARVFSDSTTLSDADVVSMTKVLTDSATLTDAQIKSFTKVLSESVTATEAFAKLSLKSFAESIAATDSAVINHSVKSLVDFLVIKEWISINLRKQINWVNPGGNENTFDSLWGKYQFGRVPFGGVKPTTTWTNVPRTGEAWTNANGHKYNY